MGKNCLFHKVKCVNALSDYKLSVQFAEGITKIYDVSILFEKHEMFLPLKDDAALFSDVVVDQGGYGIIWNDDIDISCDELWENGTAIKTPFDGLMAFSDATFLWDLKRVHCAKRFHTANSLMVLMYANSVSSGLCPLML